MPTPLDGLGKERHSSGPAAFDAAIAERATRSDLGADGLARDDIEVTRDA